jgi:hypothetical protein
MEPFFTFEPSSNFGVADEAREGFVGDVSKQEGFGMEWG